MKTVSTTSHLHAPALIAAALTGGFYLSEVFDRENARTLVVLACGAVAALSFLNTHARVPIVRVGVVASLALPFALVLMRSELPHGLAARSALFFIGQCFLILYFANEFSRAPERFITTVRTLFWCTALGFVLVPLAGADFRGQEQADTIVNLGNELGGTVSAAGVALVMWSRRSTFWFYLVATVGFSIASESRATLVVLAVVLLPRVFTFDSRVALRLALGAVAAAAFLLLTPAQSLLERFENLDVVAAVTGNVDEAESGIGRVVQWEACLTGFGRAQLVGGGYGEIARISEELRGIPKSSHSLYCTIGVEGSPFALGAFLGLLAPFVHRLRRASRSGAASRGATAAYWMLIAVAIQALFRLNYDSPALYISLAGVLAFGSHSWTRPRPAGSDPAKFKHGYWMGHPSDLGSPSEPCQPSQPPQVQA